MKIGVLRGGDETFAGALTERVGAESGGRAQAGLVVAGGRRADDPGAWDVVVDLVSAAVPYFGALLRQAAAHGVRVVNDPFVVSVCDRFTALAACRAAGFATPRTVLLPQKDYGPGVPGADLCCLEYPLPWDELVEAVGGTGFVRAARPSSGLPDLPVRGREELVAAFDRTGEELVMLQEALPWERFVRVLVVGRGRAVVTRYDPAYGTYAMDPSYLEEALEARVVDQAVSVCRLLGLDLNAVDFAIVDGEPRLLDAFGPWPDLSRGTLTPFYFEKAVHEVAGLCLRLAGEGRRVAARRAPGASAAPRLRAHLLDAPAPLAGGLRRVRPPAVRRTVRAEPPRVRVLRKAVGRGGDPAARAAEEG